MRRRIVHAFAFLLVAFSAHALDFGLDLRNDSVATFDLKEGLGQTETATAWISSAAADFEFRLAGLYEFSANFDFGGLVSMRAWRLDVGESYLKFGFPEILGPSSKGFAKMGRIWFADTASRVLSGLADGFQLNLRAESLDVELLAGTTGLLFKDNADVVISKSDYDDLSKDEIYFAPARAFAGLRLAASELLPRHDFSLDLHAQMDLRPTDPVHTQYAELHVSGRPLGWLKWDAYAIGETWLDNGVFTAPSMAAGARARLSFPEIAGLMIVQSNDWASGSIGAFRAYSPIRQTPVATVYRASFTDIFYSSLNVAVRPMRGLVTGLSGIALLRASDQLPSDGDSFPVSGNSPFLGWETAIQADFSLTSDISLGIKGGCFAPNAVDCYVAGSPLRWLFAFDFSVSF